MPASSGSSPRCACTRSGGLTLEPFAWGRADGGGWRPCPMAHQRGHGRGAPWTLAQGDEEELREFLDLLAGSRQTGRVHWAVERFLMGLLSARATSTACPTTCWPCARCSTAPTRPAAPRATPRLAALCADEPHRKALQRRFELAFALEDFAMGGGDAHEYVERQSGETPHGLAWRSRRTCARSCATSSAASSTTT